MEKKPSPWPEIRQIHTLVFDFDGVFTNNKVHLNGDGQEWVQCDRSDGTGFSLLHGARDRGIHAAEFFILSAESNPVVSARAGKLKIGCHQAVGDKLAFLEAYLSKKRPNDQAPFAGLIYLGNDLNDIACMEKAGFSVAPSDAHSRVREIASAVLPQKGGEGFIREFIERFLKVDLMPLSQIHELVSYKSPR